MSGARPSACIAGDAALVRGAWEEARQAYSAILAAHDSPEALEGLGSAAWWLDLADVVIDSRERAYTLYLERKDHAAAARVAVWLAWDYWAFRSETAVANGWLQRARRLLSDQPSCSEQAWLEVREASLILLEEGDPARALSMAAQGILIAREVGNIDLEMLGRAVQGLALVTAGDVPEGMRNLDEVNTAVIAGEVKDLVAIGLSSCYLIAACEKVRDYDRALQWCKRLKLFCAKWGLRPLFAVCRTQYASICLWRGTWPEAEEELQAASAELAASRPAMTGDAIVRLAELRRRQGRLDEAASLLDQAHASGTALLGRAELAFDCGDLRTAVEQAERYLRRVPVHNRTDRAAALELLVRSLTNLKEWQRANTALQELSEIARIVATVPIRAAASYASGYLALDHGRPDTARQYLEDAVDLFQQSGAPFETARARLELAASLGKLGRAGTAVEEATKALKVLSGLNAELEMKRGQGLLDELATMNQPARQTTSDEPDALLTRREIEVLCLVAEGLSNQNIAERLFVSEHTVHRHLANILNKLGVSTRAAAVAQAARRGLLT
jgi:LuxR family maltose regulon positive regulatory protein